MILATLANEIRNLSNMFLPLQKYHHWNLITKRELGFDHEDICGKLEIIPGFHFYISTINSKHLLSFLFSFKVELMLLLAILNGLKGFRWYFLMFANSWIYWKVELLQHVNMKHNNKFYWYVKSFHLTIYWQVVVLYFNPAIFHNL